MDQDVLQLAGSLCRAQFGSACRLEPLQELVAADWGRSTVWRCSLSGGSGPATLVLKQSNLGGGHGTNEARVLRSIRHAALPDISMPRLLAADEAAGLLLLSDLGELGGNRLADLRDNMDHGSYLELLARLMEALGRFNRLHGIDSEGIRPLWESSLPEDRTGHAAMHLPRLLDELPGHFSSLAIELDSPALDELAHCRKLLADTSAHCLTHADICPSNVALINGRLAIYDFEVAGLRHPAIDAAWPGMRSLRCYHCTRLDSATITMLESKWLQGFGMEAGSAQALFSAGNLVWLAAMLAWLPELLESERERDSVPDRCRLLASLRAMQGCHERHAALPAMAKACRTMELKLAGMWPDAVAG
ncbi:phosphotransferase [bacterium]|nr:phosphotransferase [bacterium]